jgi:hypothetical protein
MPILVEDARMPRAADLPPDVAGLCEYQAHFIHDGTYDQNVNALISRLREIAPPDGPRVKGARAGAADSGRRKAPTSYPAKITESYLQTDVSGMGRDDLIEFVSEVLRRGWEPEDAFEYGLCYSPLKPPTKLPARITVAWLATNAALLGPKRQRRLIQELRRRGWSDEELRQHVLDNRQPGLAPRLPGKIFESWVERYAPLMTSQEQDALAKELVLRGWSSTEIRKHMPLAQFRD